ncbi:hypothetical protein E1262_25550 [Jiangella aurantiaca]|uniref:Uncharacterized protein n=1 Tax=Jiangella aurantiaca TaxID=2530373 RepID=A0A4R5A0P6_9ACTN|nr:hypothetical protein [Jiangella aurantiaca]TDD65338.1 hypothetical protein E1262_25550 [Jiangella aurantiaca]
MTVVEPALTAALRRQLAARRAALDAGAHRVGWKLGMGPRERIGAGPVVGHLTSVTVLPSGSVVAAGALAAPHADAEAAVRFGRRVEPSGGAEMVRSCVDAFGIALELCDLGGTDDPEQIVAANVFHRAVAFGPDAAA